MKLDKCDMYTVKKILVYRGTKMIVAPAERETQEEKQTHNQITKVSQ